MRKIAWEKWEDDQHYLESVSAVDTIMTDFENSDLESEESEFELELDQQYTIAPIMVNTPLGQYSVFDPMLPSKMFDCWVGHTNFDLSEKEGDILELIDGVESLAPISRYRFFIGVGKLFDFQSVRKNIEKILTSEKSALYLHRDKMNYLSSQSKNDPLYSFLIDSLKQKRDSHLIIYR